MLIYEIKDIFLKNSIKCGSHKKILKDIILFDEEMDIDTLRKIDFTSSGINLYFELSYEYEFAINLPNLYPFETPDFFIYDNQKKYELKDFCETIENNNLNFEFEKIINYINLQKPDINIPKILELFMKTFAQINIGWYVE